MKVWGFEAKGRVTARTAAAEERNLHFYNRPHVRIDDVDAHEEVANEGERFQVLQHAFVYDFDTVVLAISDSQSYLIRSTVIDYSTELKNHFGKVLNDLKDISLAWAYPETDNQAAAATNRAPKVLIIPARILSIADTIKTINGSHTLQGTANIWFSLVRQPKPFPSFLRFIPSVYAFWNSVKGGSDTTTKLMDDCIIRVPKAHLNTETVAITRIISLLFVEIHRLNQVFTAKEDVDEYPSLAHYRKAASKRSTFHVSLLLCDQLFKNEYQRRKDEIAGNNNTQHVQQSSTISTPTRDINTRPTRTNPS